MEYILENTRTYKNVLCNSKTTEHDHLRSLTNIIGSIWHRENTVNSTKPPGGHMQSMRM